MIVETFAVGPLQCNCSIVGDEGSREAIVVDPGSEVTRILDALTRLKLRATQIVVTHAHIDHIAGAKRLQQSTGAPILYNQRDLALVDIMDVQAGWLGIPTPEVTAPDVTLEHGTTLILGARTDLAHPGIRAETLHTPGHTEGSVCLYLPEHSLLFAGDTLFAGSVGRTDLPGGNATVLLRSIHTSLLVLPDDTRVIPGHGPATTIGAERDSNPFLQHH